MKQAGKLILLIEHDEVEEALTARALRQARPSGEVVVAHGEQDAIAFLEGTGPHAGRDPHVLPRLVLMDIGAGEFDGVGLIRKLRACRRGQFIPVVVLASSKKYKDAYHEFCSGANSVVLKPVDFDAYLEVLRRVTQYWLTLNEAPSEWA